MAALRYVNDSIPGIRRRKCGKGYAFYYPDGSRVTQSDELQRIKSLRIPPAYHSVWICPFSNGHIQATGRDARNRKQYHYHPLWREVRDRLKFTSMTDFGRAISTIRSHIAYELGKPPSLNKKQIICAIIYLLDKSGVRIGNKIYAKENKTYGITTLRKKHLSINGSKAIFSFTGKNSKAWEIVLDNKKIIKILKKCEEIPGYEIFKYYDENNNVNCITSQDINYYLQSLTGLPLTAKDFRTWIASRESFCRLLSASFSETDSAAKIKSIIKEVAELLGHTPTICQKNYIFPEIITSWSDGRLERWLNVNAESIRQANKDNLFLMWLESLQP
ncbi:DNA topoisomerase IB [Legionella sp. 16cNR16C]|uniref:DNA topoisomerase IB n=1 Tax=Legionella sp. 16cNR16C TaxID=2905656 RepID=UPI001E63C8BC|nr:DNA topoisomerase IB [Legionella sp. 16cNR16C]MCE3044225.1 DNA topoisomerase IB [Legionella sp. 16cNR16C]